MFSQLGPLFKTYLRQAEPADTRLEIRRDEKQDQGKKQQHEEPVEEASILWDDSTSVSIEALKAFLVGFLNTRSDHPAEGEAAHTELSPMASLAPENRPPATLRAARAVKAYTALSDHASAFTPAVLEPVNEERPVDLVDLLKADEVRTMHVLIAELDNLARKGVQTLVIERADTFLESLVQAVRLEQSKP